MELAREFLDMLGSLGPVADGLADVITGTAPDISVRLNRRKPGITVAGEAGRVPWCEDGVYLDARPQFTLDPLLHAGCYYVQDASSMFITHVVRSLTRGAAGPMLYLDACAAPGGKTTAAMDSLPAGSLVVANEYDSRRAAILAENVIKWGYPDVMVTRGDTSRLADAGVGFDIVAADVPCSGEGMMRKDATAVSQWTPALVRECASRQRAIIDNLVQTVRPGGYLIYSTCTYNTFENEDMLAYLASEHGFEPVTIDVPPGSGIAREVCGCMPAYRFMPHMTRGEGLFMGVVRRNHGDAATRMRRVRDKPRTAGVPEAARALMAVHDDEHKAVCDGTAVSLVSRRHEAVRQVIAASCDVLVDGVAVGMVKGRDFIPSHALSMSPGLVSPSVPRVELPVGQALDYLRREAVTLPPDSPRGHVLATYMGVPLGWLKNLGSRANNLYPAEYRIRNL